MNKKVAVVVLGIVLLLAGVGVVVGLSKKPAVTPKVNPVNNQVSQVSPTQSPSSLRSLLTAGVSQTCTYTNDSGKGTVYVTGGKVRGDFEVNVNSTLTTSHMIAKDNTSYIWTDGQATGFKTTFNPQSISPTGTATNTSNQNFDPDKNLNYNCNPGSVAETMFDLPQGVNFMEFNATAPSGSAVAPSGSLSPTGSTSSSQCSYCNSLQGENKTACLKALNCQ